MNESGNEDWGVALTRRVYASWLLGRMISDECLRFQELLRPRSLQEALESQQNHEKRLKTVQSQ